MRTRVGFICASIVVTGPAPHAHAADERPPVPAFTVRDGYEVTLVADGLENARFMEFDDKGTLYLSRPLNGDILALRDEDHDGYYEKRTTFAKPGSTVHGMQFVDGWLWYTRSGEVRKARDTNGDGVADQDESVVKDLPNGGHWWRSILVTPQGFYTSIGDSGNITDQTATDRQKAWFYTPDGAKKTLFISGIRNTEKLRFRPGTAEVWGFDHGSDNFGARLGEKAGKEQSTTDLNPPDELNHYVQGGFYGHPFVVGNKVPRYEYMDRKDILELCDKTIPPEWCMGAHWATNGWCFIDPSALASGARGPGAMPPDHAGDVFVACHGSWNSVHKVGYCIARVLFDNGHPYGLLKIVSTLSSDGEGVLARPVDCVQAPDGTILFSCDHTNRIFRISWTGAGATRNGKPPQAQTDTPPDSNLPANKGGER